MTRDRSTLLSSTFFITEPSCTEWSMHAFTSRLFLFVCLFRLFWHVNGAADGLPFRTNRRGAEAAGFIVFHQQKDDGPPSQSSPAFAILFLCLNFCFLSFILPTQFLPLSHLCFHLSWCASWLISSLVFRALLKHLSNNWPVAAGEIAAWT